MRLAVHVVRLLAETVWFGVATRRAWLVLAVLLGLALTAIVLSAQATAPFVVYPFA
jgi:hypothetical protein